MNAVELATERLRIRPFVADDLAAIHRILEFAFGDGSLVDDPAALAERRRWLEWSILSQEWHAKLHQPPYGEVAMVRQEDGVLVGAVGYVPCLDRFGQLPTLRPVAAAPGPAAATPEVGLFWAVDPAHQGRGYATEAARAMVEHAFAGLGLGRIVATTQHDNLASQAVMRKLGMRLDRNPLPDPPWLQVVGILESA